MYQELLKDWALAKKNANNNSEGTVMYKDTPCSPEMGLYYEAEEKLLEYSVHHPEHAELKRYLEIFLDRGCSSCWLSSRVVKAHPECEKKIEEFFKAREALYVQGLELLLNEEQKALTFFED